RNDSSAVGPLKQLATSGENPLGRLHALWTLEGMRQLDFPTLKRALSDTHPEARAAAMRISEPLLKNQPELVGELLKRVGDAAPGARLQLALTLGEVLDPRAEDALAKVARQNAADVYIRDAVISGLAGRELEFLERLLEDKSLREEATGSGNLFRALAGCVFTEAKPDRVNRLLALAANRPSGEEWRQLAVLDGILSTASQGPKVKTKPVRLNAEPAAFAALDKCEKKEIQERAKRI